MKKNTNYTRRRPVFKGFAPEHKTQKTKKLKVEKGKLQETIYRANVLTISMSLVTELARSETEELASVRRLLSSGVWPLGLPPVLLPADLRENNKRKVSPNC